MQNIGQRRIFSIKKIYFPLRVIFLFTWNKITLRFTDRCYSLKVDPILVFLSLLFRRSCDSSTVVHGIIIFSGQRAVNKTIVTEWVAGVPREITWFPRENSCKRVRPFQPFFLPSDLPRSLVFFSLLSPFLSHLFWRKKHFASPPLLRDLRLLRGSSRIRASPHSPCENKGGRDARRNLGWVLSEIIRLRAQSRNLEILKKARSSKLSRNDTIPKL